jgi:hypothetical protein
MLIRLGWPRISERLSVQTLWGQVQPRFMPEGIGPASGILQSIVASLFEDFGDFVIAIFDNLLVLCEDYNDARRKMELILDRCIKQNVFLKLSKSWLGFESAKFFGYVCRRGRYELSDERKAAIKAVPMPNNLKQMQSFLGTCLFFRDFIVHYSSLVAPLNDMVKQSFPWNSPETWQRDYIKIFEEVKDKLQEATSIFLPN